MSTQNLINKQKQIYLYTFFSPHLSFKHQELQVQKWRYWTIEGYFGGGLNPLRKPYPYSFFLGEEFPFLGTWNIWWIQTILTKTELQKRASPPPPLDVSFSRLRCGSWWGIRLWPLPTPVRRSLLLLLLLFVEFPGGVPQKKWNPILLGGLYTPED